MNKQNEIIITNRNLLNIVASTGYQIDGYPLGDNPLKKIMGKEISLSEIFNINKIIQVNNHYQPFFENRNLGWFWGDLWEILEPFWLPGLSRTAKGGKS